MCNKEVSVLKVDGKKKDQKEKSLFRYDKFQNGKRSTALLIKRRKIKKWGDVLNGRNEDYLSFIR